VTSLTVVLSASSQDKLSETPLDEKAASTDAEKQLEMANERLVTAKWLLEEIVGNKKCEGILKNLIHCDQPTTSQPRQRSHSEQREALARCVNVQVDRIISAAVSASILIDFPHHLVNTVIQEQSVPKATILMEFKQLCDKSGPVGATLANEDALLQLGKENPTMFKVLLSDWTPHQLNVERILDHLCTYEWNPPVESVQALLDAGAAVWIRTGQPNRYALALHWATIADRLDIATVLLPATEGLDVKHIVPCVKSMRMLELLLPHASSIDLHRAVANAMSVDILQRLVEEGLAGKDTDLLHREIGNISEAAWYVNQNPNRMMTPLRVAQYLHERGTAQDFWPYYSCLDFYELTKQEWLDRLAQAFSYLNSLPKDATNGRYIPPCASEA